MKRVLVIGATGFIGCRITELAYLTRDYDLRAGVRSLTRAARLGRFPVAKVPCDVSDPASLRSAMAGVDVVVNSTTGSSDVIVAGTRHVVEAAREAGVKTVIHLSTVDVYGAAQGDVSESNGRGKGTTPYAEAKIAAEEVCESFHSADGPSICILRPSVVYGPFSTLWTVRFAQRIQSGSWGTFGAAGEGCCNLVYVDDVAGAVFHVIDSGWTGFDVFNVNGPEVISWNDYFTRLNRALGRPPLPVIGKGRASTMSSLLQPVRRLARMLLDRYGSLIMKVYARSRVAKRLMKGVESTLKNNPTPAELALYAQDVRYSMEKSREQLGFAPATDVASGLETSVAWLRHHGYVEPMQTRPR